MDEKRRSSEDLKRRPNSNPYAQKNKKRSNQEYDSSRDISSGAPMSQGFDLNRMATKNKNIQSNKPSCSPKVKITRKQRIIWNVVLTLVLVLSLIGSTAFTLLDVRLLYNDKQTETKQYEEVVTSPSGDVSYILVAGTDLSEELTDIMMVACYDLKNNQMDILQIPRDTYIADIDYGYGKLNSVYGNPREGEAPIKALMRRINSDFALPIDHYVTVTIPGFRKIVDALGGVEMTFTRSYVVEDSRPTDTGGSAIDITLAEGATEENPITLNLKGFEAEGFVRHRNSYAMGDLGRVEAQRQFYAAFAKKVKNMGFSELKNIVTDCMSDISTDLRLGQMLGYVEKAHEMDLDKISIEAVPGSSTPPEYYYRARSNWPRLSYFSVDKTKLVKLLNDKFHPYETTMLTEDDLGITPVPEYNEEYQYFDGANGKSFSELNGDKTKTTESQNSESENSDSSEDDE